jgi:hypothetical protein
VLACNPFSRLLHPRVLPRLSHVAGLHQRSRTLVECGVSLQHVLLVGIQKEKTVPTFAETVRWRNKSEAVVCPVARTAHCQRWRPAGCGWRPGQNGYVEKSGRWYVVRFWRDTAGQEKRQLVRERICPISGPGLLSKSERTRRAREIIQASGADSAEYFHAVVKPNPTGVTFREQSKFWLQQCQNRKRKPIGTSYAVSIQGALDRWLLPAIADIPLSEIDNLTVKPLIEKMHSAGLSARTVNKYVEHVKQVVASLKGANGEPIHKRVWDAETMDLPVVEYSEQKRPSLKADAISRLIETSSGQEQALYVLLAATGAGLRSSCG